MSTDSINQKFLKWPK